MADNVPEKTRPCEICRTMIDLERIEFQPETRLCAEHAQQILRFGGEFKVTLTEVSLSKQGSMKGNRGDVAVTDKKRNFDAIEKLRNEFERENPE